MRCETIIENWPAYKILAPVKNQRGEVVIDTESRDKFMIKMRDLFHPVSFGSIRIAVLEDQRYAAEFREGYDEKMNRAVENGHPTIWVSLEATCIKSNDYEKTQETRHGLELGDVVVFEGIRFTLGRSFNGNPTLEFCETQFKL